MKEILIVTFIVFISSFTNSFSQAPEKWMQWQSTNCYENIEYRARYVKTNGSRHEWEIQFRNNYDRLIVFNYGIEEDSQALAITTHRKTLRTNEVSKPISVYTQKENFLLFTDRLSFSIDGRDWIPCDD